MKKIVIIGANNFQLPLIKKAKQMGIETHVFAWEQGAVGREISDYFYPISIINKELILKESERIKPDGIISIGSDLATITVNYVADKLGLIGNSPDCTRVTTNKYAMREKLSRDGLPCPLYSIASDIQENISFCGGFPLIVKPTDRSGSRGVTKVNDIQELKQAVTRASSESFTSGYIVEKFITGHEYSVEMISWKNDHHFVQITEKETSGEPFFVEKGQHQPASLLPSVKEKIISIVKKALTCLNVEFGASHSEILIDRNNEVYIVEIGARMGGDYIGSHLVELSTGYDFVKEAINVAIGSFNEIYKTKNNFSGVYFIMANPGILKKITDNTKKYTEIVLSEVFYGIGDRIKETKESNDRVACYVYQSATGKFLHNNNILVLE
jgi:biotin carboxylase